VKTETPKPEPAPPPVETAHEDDAPPPVVVPAPEPRPKLPEPKTAPRPEIARVQDIWVTSNPPGAKAVIDGNLAQSCATPCTLRGAPGRHNIAVSQAGFMNEYREVNIGGAPIDLPQITLRQPEGTLFLTSTPSGARILVNGRPVPQVTPAPLSLRPGTYSITIEKNGNSKTSSVTVRDGVVRLDVEFGQ